MSVSSTPDPTILIPFDADVKVIKEELYILISWYVMHFEILIYYIFMFRIIVEHEEQFQCHKSDVCKHIPSKYSKEMAEKSKTVWIRFECYKYLFYFIAGTNGSQPT